MGLHLRFPRWQRPVDISDHVETLSHLTETEVLNRTQAEGKVMAANQRLGYVLVRADKVVRRHVARLAILRSLDMRTEQRVLKATRERVVDAVCAVLELSRRSATRAAA